jgi:hypothetical protein
MKRWAEPGEGPGRLRTRSGHLSTRQHTAERGSTLWTTSKYGLKPLIDCPNLHSTPVHGAHRVSSGVLEHGLDVRPEMPIRSKRAEVCTEAAILY